MVKWDDVCWIGDDKSGFIVIHIAYLESSTSIMKSFVLIFILNLIYNKKIFHFKKEISTKIIRINRLNANYSILK